MAKVMANVTKSGLNKAKDRDETTEYRDRSWDRLTANCDQRCLTPNVAFRTLVPVPNGRFAELFTK